MIGSMVMIGDVGWVRICIWSAIIRPEDSWWQWRI